jgi:hypothetical protein
MLTLAPSVTEEEAAKQLTSGGADSLGWTTSVVVNDAALPLVSTTWQVTVMVPETPWVFSVADTPWLVKEPAVVE